MSSLPSPNETNKQILKNVSRWKLDAVDDLNRDIFYQRDDFTILFEENRPLIVGRKGSGKTAVARYISGMAQFRNTHTFVSFKDILLQDLYEFEDKRVQSISKYTLIWKYIILYNICYLLKDSNIFSDQQRGQFAKFFQGDPVAALKRSVKGWIETSLSVNVFGVEGKYSGRPQNDVRLSLATAVDELEEFLYSKKFDLPFAIFFDELDEEYNSFIREGDDYQYFSLVAGLVKATIDITRKMQFSQGKIFVLIRDDLYDLVNDPDKNKWSDFVYRLNWSRNQLKQMIAKRCNIQIQNDNKIFILEDKIMSNWRKRFVSYFDYLCDFTHERPRDIIKFFQICANEAIQRGSAVIGHVEMAASLPSYSTYLYNEIKDEVYSVIPNFDDIMSCVALQGVRRMNSVILERKLLEQNFKYNEIEFKTTILLMSHFSIIGPELNKKERTVVYKYEGLKPINSASVMYWVHPGLWKYLKLERDD